MKLHLPKGLRSAVLACFAVVSGFATTVGTGVIVGGTMTAAFVAPQAQADYTWTGGTGDKTAADWNNAENWNIGDATFAGSGPGTPNSDMWDTITVDGAVTFGSDADRALELEGWNPRYDLNNGATVYGAIKKFQGTTIINLDNGSHLNLVHKNGHFEASTINIGANSSFTLKLTGEKNNSAMAVNLNAPTAAMNFTADSALTLSGPITVKTVLNDIAANSMGTQKLGLTAKNVTLSALTLDIGEGWTQTQNEITADNYTQYGGMYYLAIDENGEYSVVYSTAAALAACEWNGGDLSWGVDTAFSNSVNFANGAAVSFTTADATVTLTSDVVTKTISVADGIAVSIGGDHAFSSHTVSVGAGATLRLATTGNSISALELGSLATLSLAPGKEATLADVLGTATISGTNTAIIEVSGEGTYLTGVGNKFNSYAVISVTDGAKLNADGADWGGEGKQIIISDGATLERTTGDDMLGWGSSQNLNILSGGTLDLGTTRATMDSADVINLDNGTITGTSEHAQGALDYYQGGGVIKATNGSVIAAPIGSRNSSNALQFDVTADADDSTADLTISGVLKNQLSFRKTGSGTLLLTAANTYGGTATVEEGTLMIDGEGSVGRNIHLLDGATLALGSGVTLQGNNILEGEISITEAITLAGALTLGENAILNLDNWTGDSSYQLFTIAENGSITPQAVTIKGQSDTWMLNTSGALIQSSELHWLGGDLTWAADTEFSGGTYNPSAMVIFDASKGDVNANVTEAISAQIITIESGTNLIVSGEGSLTTGRLTLDGTLTLTGTEFTAASVQAGADATLVLDGGSEKQWQINELPQTGANKVEMAVTVASGSLYLTSASQTMGDITVEDGAGLRLGGNASIGTLTLNGNGGWTSDGEVINAALLRNNGLGDITVNKVNIATASTAQVDAGTIVIGGTLSGDILTKTGEGTLRLDGDVTNAGIVINGGTVRWGGNTSDKGTNALACESITINAGGTFQINHSSTDCSSVGIVLNGGRLYMEDQSQNYGSTFKSLTVQTDSTIEYKWNGALNFNELTGAGNLAITGNNDAGGAGFNSIVNYTGTISNTTTREVVIGAVSQAADNILTLDCDVTLQDFSKTGEGSMIVTGAATLKGILSMNYEGTLDLGTAVALDNNLLLSYTDTTKNVISLGELTSAINIDLFALSADDLASGINLGIADTTDASMLQVAGLKADEYTLTSVDGNWFLRTTTALHTDWDMNWGAAGIAGAPDTIAEVAIPADATAVALGGSGSLTGGNANAMVYGGAIEAPFTGDTWINASEGTYQAIIGGTNANNWNSGTRADFNGDSHIVIDGATVGYLIGGIHKDGKGAQFNGSSYISVFSGDVTGAIVGSGTAGHNNSAVQNGDTNIFIYTALNTNTGSLPSGDAMNVPSDMVIGGYAWGRNDSGGQTINGNTNITIDLSSYSGDASTFGKHIVGGHFNNYGSTQTVTGSTNITIDLAGLSMADGRKIVGGNWSDQGNTNIGSANITIKNGTFGAEITAGSRAASANTSHTIGATGITIDNGTFNGAIYGGNYLTNGGNSTVGDSTVTINGGTFSQNIITGSHVGAGAANLSLGNVNITVSGGTLTGDLIAGHYVNGTGNAALTAATGDTNITLTGGKVGTIYGGSYILRNKADSTVQQGNISVDLQGGEITGSVYAGGYQAGSTALSSASTTVQLDASVSFTGTNQVISGGYQSTAGTSTVTGDRTLAFTGTQDRSAVSIADFDTITVSGSDSVSIGALSSADAVTKLGTGTLTLGGSVNAVSGGLSVEAGTLATAGATSLGGALTLANGVGLDVSAGSIELNGALTLGSDLALTVEKYYTGEYLLLSGISSADITDTVAASSLFASINGETNLADHSVRLQDGNLILTLIVREQRVWDAANSTWENGEQFGATAEDVFNYGDYATFGALAADETVTVVGAIDAASVSIAAGEGMSYTFEGGTISTEVLEIGAGTAIFGNNTLQVADLTSAEVDGVLDLTAYGDTNLNANFKALQDKVSGEGTVKLAGSSTLGDNSELRLASIDGTEVTTNVNYEFTNSVAIHGSGNVNETLLVTKDFAVEGELRMESAATVKVQEGGALSASSISLGHSSRGNAGHLVIEGGTVTASKITNGASTPDEAGLNTLTISGGTLELTGTEGIASVIGTTITGGTLKTADNSWSITGATIGGATIETGAGAITLNGATLTATVDNASGNLVLTGAIDITSDGYETTTYPNEYSSGNGNGYSRTNTVFTVATDATKLTATGVTSWTVDGSAENVSYADGIVTVTGTDWGTTYYLNTTDTALSSIAKTNSQSEALTTIVLNGANLTLDEELGAVSITAQKEGTSIVTVGTSLTSTSLTATSSQKVALDGTGTYVLADTTSSLGTGVELASSWTGTVQLSNVGSAGNMTSLLNALGNANSTVEVTAITGYFNTAETIVNLHLVNGANDTAAISINNLNSDDVGSPQRYAVLSGDITGSGDIKFLSHPNSASLNRQVNYKFTGDVSGWDGAFINAGAYNRSLHIIFAGAATTINADVVNAGNVENCKSTLNIGDDTSATYTMNGDVDVDFLVVNQATSFNGSLAVSEGITNNGGMTFASDVTLSGQLSGTGSLTGTNMALQGAVNEAGDIVLTGGLTLGTTEVASALTAGVLDIAGGITFNKLAASQITAGTLASNLNLIISDSVLLSQISQSDEKSLTLLNVTDLAGNEVLLNGADGAHGYDSADGQYRYTWSWDGTALTITSKANGLKWAGTEDNNVWGEGDSWNTGSVPTSTESVVFDGNGCSEVIVMGDVAVDNLTVELIPEATTTEYALVAGADSTSISVTKNLSVNSGSLELGVDTTVSGRTEVVAGASLSVVQGALVSQYGLNNAGDLNISNANGKPTLVSVTGGDLINTGTITNSASNGGGLQIGNSMMAPEEAPGILNSGTIINSGLIGVNGDLGNIGTYEQTDGSLIVLGDVNNTTGDISLGGGSTQVNGTLYNDNELTLSGDDTTLAAGAMVNTGSFAIQSGSATIGASSGLGIALGSEPVPGNLDNNAGTIIIGTADTAGSLTVGGDVNNTNGGSITVQGGSLLDVAGDVDNKGGSLTLEGTGSTANIGGDLLMSDGSTMGTLTVGEGTALNVAGDLEATSMTLEFGGNVTVGGDVDIDTLTNDGIFTANGSADTTVNIGTLANNGTLSVGTVAADGTLTGGNLNIGTLNGSGAVNVGVGGSLSITDATTFTGELNNLGTLTVADTTLDGAQAEGATAGDIIATKLTITEKALGYDGDAYQMGDVQADTLVIDGLTEGATRLQLNSLAAKTGDTVKLILSDVEDGTVTSGSYHIFELDTPMNGTIADNLDLSNYGYNADGVYDAYLPEVQSDYMQALLKNNTYVTFSDTATSGVATADDTTSDLYMSIVELPDELSVWNLDGAHNMTEAGLTVLDANGKLVSGDILDKVKTVVVTGTQTLDLTGTEADTVTLNSLTAADAAAGLTISGDASDTDSATITTAQSGYAGTLALTGVNANISGKVATLNMGDDAAATLNVSNTAINVAGQGVALAGNVNGGSVNFDVQSDNLAASIYSGDVTLNDTAININQADTALVISGVGSGVTEIADLDATNGTATVTLNGGGLNKYFENARLENGQVVADRNADYVEETVRPTTENGAAGAALLSDSLVYVNPQAQPETAPMQAALLDAVDNGNMTDKDLAAVAGASVTSMGMALSGDVERQLRAIRNRTTTMGVNECVVNEGMPYFNAWVNAEGNNTKLDKDSTFAGYDLNSWGGTVGMDVDFDPHFTAGLAITAMYGDLTANAADSAEGDMDTYYVSAFARYAASAWTHTFVATMGIMDASLNRTVYAGGNSYKTEGNTSGMSFGLMYEAGYVVPMNEDATACLQPIFNVMLRHSSVDSYTEKGSDAGLEVGSQSMTTLTFGLGARMQAVVGESLYNRASIFEARALAKLDVGDRSSEADVAFLGGHGSASVESAELGAFGVELGAGLTIPVGDDDGSIFVDGSVELRSGYTNVNGTVGYRINF